MQGSKSGTLRLPLLPLMLPQRDTLLRHSRNHGDANQQSESRDQDRSMASDSTSVDAGQHESSALGMSSMSLQFPPALESHAVDGAAKMPSFMRTPDISPHTNSQIEPTECTMLGALPSTEMDLDPGNQPCPGPALWGGDFDTEWSSWLPGSDFDLDAINVSLLNVADVAFDPFPPDIPDIHQEGPVTTPSHVRRRWHTFSGMTPSGQTTPNVVQEQNPADENFRQKLAENLRQRVQTGILPSASFLVLLLQSQGVLLDQS